MNRGDNITPLHTQFPSPYSNEGAKRTGVSPSHRNSLPPISPHSRIPLTRLPAGSPHFSPGPRSSLPPMSPSPTSFRDSFRPLSPSPSSLFHDFPSAPVENRDCSIGFNKNPSLPPPIPFSMSKSVSVSGNTLLPRKAHKRSNSDNIGLNEMIAQKSPELIYPKPLDLLVRDSCRGKEPMDELFSGVMNLDNENGDDMERDSQGESSANASEYKTGPTTSGVKRRAGKDIDSLSRHYRSVSVDSCFNELLKQPPSPGTGNLPGNVSSTNSVHGGNDNAFSLESGNGEYTAYELKQISGSTKLTEIASDPKHVRRILANRVAAARSKQRKSRYLTDLEDRAQTLENEVTTLSTKITFLENEKTMLMKTNKELRIRLESEEQHAQLRDALTEQLTADVQRLKVATSEMMQNRRQFDRSNMQPLNPNMQSLNPNMFQQLNINQQQTNPHFDYPPYGQI